jgi:hypothetical protein
MRNLYNAIACAGMLLFSLSAIRAAPQYTDDNAWHQTRDQYFNGDSWRARMFERIRTDLDHIQQLAFGQDDQDRIANTKQQVTDLQSKLSAGRYDQPELDDVIASLEKVVADNRLSARDRDMLADDLSRVRDYRADHENWH